MAFAEGRLVMLDRARGHARVVDWSGRVLAAGLRLLAATWRVEGGDAVRSEIAKRSGTPLLVGFWHGKYLPLLVLLRGTRARIFIGEGARGALIGAICRSFGFDPVLLPHGHRRAAVELIRNALLGTLPCATALDGPLGPQHRVKPSLVRLATELGATLLPITMSASPCLRLRWRWDLREIPWPFAHVKIRVGLPMRIPVGLDREARDRWGEGVEVTLDALDRSEAGDPATVATCPPSTRLRPRSQ